LIDIVLANCLSASVLHDIYRYKTARLSVCMSVSFAPIKGQMPQAHIFSAVIDMLIFFKS